MIHEISTDKGIDVERKEITSLLCKIACFWDQRGLVLDPRIHGLISKYTHHVHSCLFAFHVHALHARACPPCTCPAACMHVPFHVRVLSCACPSKLRQCTCLSQQCWNIKKDLDRLGLGRRATGRFPVGRWPSKNIISTRNSIERGSMEDGSCHRSWVSQTAEMLVAFDEGQGQMKSKLSLFPFL